MNREKIIKNIVKRIEDILSGYEYSIFSFGSKKEHSDIDLTVLLPEELFPKYYDTSEIYNRIKRKFDKITEGYNNVHIFIEPFSIVGDDESYKESFVKMSESGWGNLGISYRRFYIVATGKTEAGENIVEKLRGDPNILCIPQYEGDEIFAACKGDAAMSILDFYEGKEKEGMNRMAKAIIRSIEAYRIKIGYEPAHSDEDIYKAIYEEGKLLGIYGKYKEIIEKALKVKHGEDEFNFENELNLFLELFNYFKKLLVTVETEGIPKEIYKKIKMYSKKIAEQFVERYERLNDEIKPKAFYGAMIISDELLELGNKDLLKKLSNLYELIDYINNPSLKFFIGKANLILGKYEKAKEYLEGLEPGVEIYEALALVKFKLGEKENAKKLILNALSLDPLNSNSWDLLYKLEGDEGYKTLADILRGPCLDFKKILLDENISLSTLSLFIEKSDNYMRNLLESDEKIMKSKLQSYERLFSKYKGEDLYKKLKDTILVYQIRMLKDFLKKIMDLKEESFLIFSYKDYLNSKSAIIKSIEKLDMIFEFIINLELEENVG